MSTFQLENRLEPALAYGKIDYKVDTIKPLDTYMFAKTSSAVKRKTPGTVTSSFNLERSLGTQKKLMYNDGAIGIIPQEVREKLAGREFKSFDDFREEFWKTLSDSSYAKEFSPMNIKLMKKVRLLTHQEQNIMVTIINIYYIINSLLIKVEMSIILII